MKMKRFACAVAILFVSALAHETGVDHDHHDHDEVEERTCGTPHLTQEEVAADEKMTQRFVNEVCSTELGSTLNMCPQKVQKDVTEICLWMHVIFDPVSNAGNVPDSWVQNQLRVFNDDFGGRNPNGNGRGGYQTNYQFRLEGVTRTGNANWFRNIQGNEAAVTSALARDPCRCQQVYFSQLAQNLLGYCYLPNSFGACSTRHGCFNDFNTMPGGSRSGYNLGQTVTHEVGHGFGLLHVFQGGVCTGCGGDQVCDTNPQRTSTAGCPARKDSCNDGRQDNIHNFLDYSTDVCMCEFTRLQGARMDQQLAQFRPGFLSNDFKSKIETVLPHAYEKAEALQAWNEDHPKLYGEAYLNSTKVSA